MPSSRLFAALLLGAVRLAAPLAAQSPSPAPSRPVVMVLGTYHMANPGQDARNVTADDHLAPRRQAELEELARRLAEFRPTKIAVEVPVARDSALNDRYRRWVAGTLAPRADEIDQVAFRLAKRMGHEKVWATDYRLDLDMNAVFGFAASHGQQAFLDAGMGRVNRYVATTDSLLRATTVSRVLAHANSAAADSMHALYLQMATIGADTSDVGARVTADWYARNLHIFANVARLARPGDRILVLYGSGHRPLLNQFLRESGLFDVVDVVPYLTGPSTAVGSLQD